MITASAIAHKNYLRVVFVFPDLQRLEIDLPGADPGKLAGEARRLEYFKARDYIVKKLTSWLNQRMYAAPGRKGYSIEAAKLVVLLGYYKKTSLFRLCALVAENRPAIEALAPADGSGGWKNILPILDFCDTIKASQDENEV